MAQQTDLHDYKGIAKSFVDNTPFSLQTLIFHHMIQVELAIARDMIPEREYNVKNDGLMEQMDRADLAIAVADSNELGGDDVRHVKRIIDQSYVEELKEINKLINENNIQPDMI